MPVEEKIAEPVARLRVSRIGRIPKVALHLPHEQPPADAADECQRRISGGQAQERATSLAPGDPEYPGQGEQHVRHRVVEYQR